MGEISAPAPVEASCNEGEDPQWERGDPNLCLGPDEVSFTGNQEDWLRSCLQLL